MKAYVYHMSKKALDYCDAGVMPGSVWVDGGYYVFLTSNGETVDVAGPFDDELDAELMAKRAEELAA